MQKHEPGLSRRGFSKWLAAVGVTVAATVQAVAAPTNGETVDWDSLEEELIAALTPLNEIDQRIKMVEGYFSRWERRHPWPEEPLYSSHNERIDDFHRLQNAQREHAKRYEVVLTQCAFGRRRQERNDAWSKAHEVAKRIALTPAVTLADFKAKSRISQLENESGPIHRTLIKELRNI